MNTLVFTSRHGTPKYVLLTTFGSSVAASVFNEVTMAFVTPGIKDDKIELAEVDVVVVIAV